MHFLEPQVLPVPQARGDATAFRAEVDAVQVRAQADHALHVVAFDHPHGLAKAQAGDVSHQRTLRWPGDRDFVRRLAEQARLVVRREAGHGRGAVELAHIQQVLD